MNNKKTIIMNASPLLVHAKRQLSFLGFFVNISFFPKLYTVLVSFKSNLIFHL